MESSAEDLRVFIASSSRAKALVEAMETQLQKQFKDNGKTIQVKRWTAEFKRPPKENLQVLARACRESDFVIVFFTKDDYRQKDKDGNAQEVPRDNCVFEAGLFAGGLGFDFERCFFVSSTEHVPSDVKGFALIKFEEPEGLKAAERESDKEKAEDLERCNNAIKEPAEQIAKNMLTTGRYFRPAVELYDAEHVLRNETPEVLNGNIEQVQVYVNSAEPLEVAPEFGKRVMENLKKDVRYRYYFHSSSLNASSIARMVQRLAGNGFEGATSRELKDRMAENPVAVRNELKFLVYSNLFVCFTPQPEPFAYCIHRRERTGVKAYLRYFESDGEKKNMFLEWFATEQAKRLAEQFEQGCQKADQEKLFHWADTVDSQGDPNFLKTLQQEIRKMFPETLQEAALNVCFGSET